MQTLESRTYGYARHWKPFIGKMHSLPMGIAPTYTNHMRTDQNDQEIAGILTAVAGANLSYKNEMIRFPETKEMGVDTPNGRESSRGDTGPNWNRQNWYLDENKKLPAI